MAIRSEQNSILILYLADTSRWCRTPISQQGRNINERKLSPAIFISLRYDASVREQLRLEGYLDPTKGHSQHTETEDYQSIH